MYFNPDMHADFEAQKNRKAGLYTTIICAVLILLALIRWQIKAAVPQIAQDMIEINLGNFEEGFGEVQPLIKGEKAPDISSPDQQQVAASNPDNNETVADENDDAEAAVIPKSKPNPVKAIKDPIKDPVKTNTNTPAPVTAPKPQKPKLPGYNGPKSGTGNGATEDNGYTYQGNKKGGKGDDGDVNGNPDSYGKNPGGKVGGGPQVRGDRKIVRYYSFTDDLPKATIYASVKVSPAGVGQFLGFAKGSTSRDPRYSSSITQYLRNVQFDKSDHESVVVVIFNFTVN